MAPTDRDKGTWAHCHWHGGDKVLPYDATGSIDSPKEVADDEQRLISAPAGRPPNFY